MKLGKKSRRGQYFTRQVNKGFQMLPKDRTGICPSGLARWKLLTLERRMVSCRVDQKQWQEQVQQRKGEKEVGTATTATLRQFCCRGKQRSEAAAREGPGVQVHILFLFSSFSISGRREDLLAPFTKYFPYYHIDSRYILTQMRTYNKIHS